MSSTSSVMIYGAAGYTGRLASEQAQRTGVSVILAGRSQINITQLATSLNTHYRVFDLHDPVAIISVLKEEGVKVLLNCAGPFAATAGPLISACIQAGVHYLDVSAELGSYQYALDQSDDAKKANVMLLPGCGGSVAMLGCLAAHALRNVQDPTHVDIALRVAGPMSRGSITSAAQSSMDGTRCLQRLRGELVPWGEAKEENGDTGEKTGMQFDFDNGEGPVSCFPVTLPDLITIWKATDIANIRTFACVAASENMAFPEYGEMDLTDGPTAEEREKSPYHAAVVVTGSDGDVGRAVLHTVNGYTFTAMASVEAARRVLEGEITTGFQTPAMLFGKEFVETIAVSRLVDIANL
ncbi:hypothetical protein PG989_011898 [Apiospora arundinis]